MSKENLKSNYQTHSSVALYKYKQVIKDLTKNNNVVIMKQDKGRGVVIMDKTKHQEKCLALPNTNQFVKLSRNPTKQIETKIQRVLRKIKTNISLQEYPRLYPTRYAPGKLYGTANMYKLSPTDSIEKLPIKPIVSNVKTPTYQFAKYFEKLLSHLIQSDYTVNSAKHFAE